MRRVITHIRRAIYKIKRGNNRNLTSLNDSQTEANQVNLEWWKRRDNLGDCLAIPIFEYMLKYYGINGDAKVHGTKHLMTVGSIIGSGEFDTTVWGSGIHRMNNIKRLAEQRDFRKYDIRAVRGPVTRWFLTQNGYACPEIYGDPAVIMKEIYRPNSFEKKYDISYIQHIDRKKDVENKDIHLIDIRTTDYKRFIEEICSSKRIISSSLHGIILAETYGVPAVFFNDDMDREIVKYYDWYWATGRRDVRIAGSLEEALLLEPMELPELDAMRQRLKEVFPVDLWEA